jgi:hypothetical protein
MQRPFDFVTHAIEAAANRTPLDSRTHVNLL